LLASTLLTLIVSLLALGTGPGLGIGCRDGIDAGSYHRSCRLGSAPDNSARGTNDSAYETPLQHEGAGNQGSDSCGPVH